MFCTDLNIPHSDCFLRFTFRLRICPRFVEIVSAE